MQRVTKFIGANALTVQSLHVEQALIQNAIYTQCVRWKRKPLWLPPAKSKLFRVPKRREENPVEMAEIARLFNNYRTCMKSIRGYFHDAAASSRIQTDQFHQDQIANEDFKRCSEINNAWNAAQAVQREKRMEEERKDRLETVAMKVHEKEVRDKLRQEQADAQIKKLKEESIHFITPENIDVAIAKALENVVDRNHAVDINGKTITDFNMAEKYRNPRFNKDNLRYEGSSKQENWNFEITAAQ